MPNTAKKHLRKRFFVDKSIQGGLAMRAARYWALSIAVVGMLTVIGWVFVAPGIAAITAMTTLMPVVIFDLVKFSHRFAGPMVRLRNSMLKVAAGEHVEPIRFRDGDYWKELADAFNAMQERIERAESGRTQDEA